jgi:hypothetical protein
MLPRDAALLLLLTVGPAIPALGSDNDPAAKVTTPIAAAAARVAKETQPSVELWTPPQPPKRPIALSALYGSYGVLQALDVVSTRRALASGARESNPLMNNGHLGTMIAVKAAAGASTIYFTEKLWKKNRVGAVIVMAAVNGATAAIVARNHRHSRRR